MRQQRIRIVEGGIAQPTPASPIPGYVESLKFSGQSAMTGRYETMALPRPIQIRAGRVTIFARPGVTAVPSQLTLESPRGGRVADGGDDESVLEIISLTPHAHTVTVAGGIGGGKKGRATFAAAIGSNIRLIAMAGAWHVISSHGATLS